MDTSEVIALVGLIFGFFLSLAGIYQALTNRISRMASELHQRIETVKDTYVPRAELHRDLQIIQEQIKALDAAVGAHRQESRDERAELRHVVLDLISQLSQEKRKISDG